MPIEPTTTDRRLRAAAVFLLLAATALAFAPVAGCGYVGFDDGVYVTDNRPVLSGLTARGLAWAFTTGHGGNWHPLTWISHMLDVELFGPGPRGPHVVNVALHLCATLLLFLLLDRTTGAFAPSLFAAGLFALHPLRVESVAWISERKDVLSTALGMATLYSYAAWTRRRTAAGYARTLGLFLLGLLAKPMLVTLPFVFFLLDLWPLARQRMPLRALVAEKLPFLAAALASCVVTYEVQSAGNAVTNFESLPLALRLSNGAVAAVAYLGKMAWPAGLAVLYPHPVTVPAGSLAAAVAILTALSALALRQRPNRPYLLVGWLWYLGTLVPVSGIVQIGVQAMADRYTYVPLVGIAVAIAWLAFGAVERRPSLRFPLAAAGAALLIVLGLLTSRQTAVWKDSVTLFEHAVRVTPPNAIARYNLGVALVQRRRLAEGEAQFAEAVRIWPGYGAAQHNLGLALLLRGRAEEALPHLLEARRLLPDDPGVARNAKRALAAVK